MLPPYDLISPISKGTPPLNSAGLATSVYEQGAAQGDPLTQNFLGRWGTTEMLGPVSFPADALFA